MVILLIFCALMLALLAYLCIRLVKTENELIRIQSSGKFLRVSYTVTESDLAKHKEKKIPRAVRKHLIRQLSSDIETLFPHMIKDETNGHTRYTYKFRIIPEE